MRNESKAVIVVVVVGFYQESTCLHVRQEQCRDPDDEGLDIGRKYEILL